MSNFVIINQIGLMHDHELAQLDIDPNWKQFDVVKPKNMSKEYVVIGKSGNRHIIEYTVLPISMLKYFLNNKGLAEFRKKNPNIK